MTRPVQDLPTTSSGSRSTANIEPTGKRYLSTVGNYEMAKVLGKGNFARVVEANHVILKIKVAIKIIDTSRITQEYVMKNLTREAKLLSKLQHPNIVRLYETLQNGPVYYLVTELATGGDLCSHVRNQPSGKLEENQARSYAKQLTAALRHMHSCDIVHRDLKMENIMLQDEKKEIVKIVDFGLSNQFDDVNPLKTQCGSPEYAAPELFVKGKRYGPEVDLWSLGVILFVMGSGRLPFVSPRDGQASSDERRRRLMAQINRGLTEVQERVIINLSAEYKSLLGRLLTPAPNKRINMSELIQHPWLTKRSNLKSASFRIGSPSLVHTDHDLVISELECLVDLNKRDLEMEVVSKRYSSIGGMYNILAHEIEHNPQYKFISQRLPKNRSFRRSINKTYTNSNHRLGTNGVNLTPSKIKMNNAFLRSEKELANKNKAQAMPHNSKALCKESSCQNNSIQLQPKKMSDKNIKKIDAKSMTNRYQKPHHKVPTPTTSFPKFQPYTHLNQIVTNLSKPGIHHKQEKYLKTENSSQIPKILQNGQPAKFLHNLHPSLSFQSHSPKTGAVHEGQKNDRVVHREKIFRTSKSKPEPGKPQSIARSDKVSKARHDSAAEILSKFKLLPSRDSGSNKCCLKKPRSMMKSLDKFKWTNCIFQPNHLEDDEKNKYTRSKLENLSKTNHILPEILKNYSRSKYVAANKFN